MMPLYERLWIRTALFQWLVTEKWRIEYEIWCLKRLDHVSYFEKKYPNKSSILVITELEQELIKLESAISAADSSVKKIRSEINSSALGRSEEGQKTQVTQGA